MSGEAATTRRQLPGTLDPRNISPTYRGDHSYIATFVPFADGRIELSTKDFCSFQGTACSGAGYTVTLSERCGSSSASAAAINEVRVVAVQPGVAVHEVGTPEDVWCEVHRDTVLQQGDEISCDPDGAVTLQFADNSTVVVRNTTQLKIASFFTEGGVVRQPQRQRPRHGLLGPVRPGLAPQPVVGPRGQRGGRCGRSVGNGHGRP